MIGQKWWNKKWKLNCVVINLHTHGSFAQGFRPDAQTLCGCNRFSSWSCDGTLCRLTEQLLRWRSNGVRKSYAAAETAPSPPEIGVCWCDRVAKRSPWESLSRCTLRFKACPIYMRQVFFFLKWGPLLLSLFITPFIPC